MTVSIQGRRRRKRWVFPSRIAVFFLGFLLILSEVCSLSSAEKIKAGGPRWSPARNARFFGSASTQHARALSPSPEGNYDKSSSTDKFYEEEKRLVHTGPNPLHN